MKSSPLPRDFYTCSVTEVARALLGCDLIRQLGDQLLRVRIVETEAYGGATDLASHAARGLTPRNQPMFGPPGHLYVYQIYGIHSCMNIVAEETETPAAVLIRAAEPRSGLDAMRAHRRGRDGVECTNGPGKLCQALQIDRSLNELDLTCPGPLYVTPGGEPAESEIACSPRVGVSGDELARSRPWRFYLVYSPYVSRVSRTN